MPRSLSPSQFFDPFEDYENIEFEHHKEGWGYHDPDDRWTPTTVGSIHIPGKRIPVVGEWNSLQAPGAEIEEGGSGVADRHWEDFRFSPMVEIGEDPTMSAPLMNIGAMLGEGQTPERPEDPMGGASGPSLAGRPVGVDLPAFGGDPAGYYPVDPPHSKVHTEGFWLGGRRGNLDLPVVAESPPDPGAAPYRREEDPDFPEGERLPTNLPYGPHRPWRRGKWAGGGALAAMKKVERWAQDPGGEPQGPGAPEFGTHTTDWVRESDLRNYRFGSRNLAARSKAVTPMEQLTSPEGVSTLSSAVGKGFDYYTRELARYMEHLWEGPDSYFGQGTQGQPGMDEPEETETAKQIKGALGGIAEGLAAAFAPKKAPPKRERPTIKMKDPRHPDPPVEPEASPYQQGTEGMWGDFLNHGVTQFAATAGLGASAMYAYRDRRRDKDAQVILSALTSGLRAEQKKVEEAQQEQAPGELYDWDEDPEGPPGETTPPHQQGTEGMWGGTSLRKFFEETPIPEGHGSWGAYADAQTAAEEKELGPFKAEKPKFRGTGRLG